MREYKGLSQDVVRLRSCRSGLLVVGTKLGTVAPTRYPCAEQFSAPYVVQV